MAEGEGFEIAKAFVRVTPDTDGFAEDLKAKVDEAAAAAAAKVKVGLDTTQLDADAEKAKAKVREIGDTEAKPKIGADTGELDEETEAALAKLREISDTQAEAKLGADDTDLDEKTEDAKAKVRGVDGTKATAKIGADSTAAKARIDELELELARLKLAAATGIRLPADTTAAEVKIAALMAEIEAAKEEASSGGGLDLSSLGGLSMPGGMMGGLATGLAALMPGIGGAATGLGLLGGTGALAFGGIAQALSAAHQASQNVGMTSAQTAEQQFSNTVAVQQAQQQLTQTYQQVTQAEQGSQQATYALSEANYNLGQAYVQARENIVALNDALADQKLNVQAAQLAVQQAEYQQLQVDQNAYSTQLDREQATLAVAQAKQQVKDATDQESAAQTAATLADKQGVQGSQTVIQAKQAQITATQGVADAQQQMKNATLGVEQAQQNLTNTIREQQLEWAAEQSTANSAANQFAKYMAALSPAGQAFVNAILKLQGPFKTLEGIAQSTVLPGMTTFLNGIKSLLPTIAKGVGEMGGAISQAFGAFGKQMQTPAFAKVLDGLISNGMRFVNIVLPAFAQLIQMFAKVGAQKGAVDGLAGILSGLANGLTNMLKGMSPYVGAISKVFSILGQALADIGGPLGEVIGAFASALAPDLQALLPGFNALATALGTGLASALTGVAPLASSFAKVFSIIAEAVAPVLPQFGQLIGKLGTELAPLILSMLPSIKNLADAITGAFASSLVIIFGEVVQLLPQMVQLAVQWTPIIDQVTKLLPLLVQLSLMYLPQLMDVIGDVAKVIMWFDGQWTTAFHDIKTVALEVWHDVLDPMWQGIVSEAQQTVGRLAKAWSGIQTAFKVPVNWVIQYVYDDGIAKLWNDVVGAVGLGSIKLPIIHTLASGGVLPGYAPGHDTVPALLSPGEGVLTPGATRAIGGKPAVDALNSAYAPAGGSGGPGRFSLGGIVSSIGSLLSGGLDVGKATTALLTGNTTAFVNALVPMIGGPAAGSLGTIMTALPKTLMTDAARAVMGLLAGPQATTAGGMGQYGTDALGSLPQNYRTIASYLASHGFSRFAAAGVAGNIFGESQGDPEILEVGGGGGGGLIQWTPWQSYGPLITGNASADLMTQLAAILSFGGGPAAVNRATSPSDAAMLYQDLYEKPANLTGSLPARMASANAVYKAMGWGSYDQGGWLPPGVTPVANQTGQPEAVLNQQQWQDTADLTEAVRQLVAHLSGASGGSAGGVTVNQIWNGPQMPSQETLAEIDRHLMLLLG